MSDLLREIQEDIQREKWLSLWQRYGRVLIAAAIVLVLSVAANQAWKAYQHSKDEAETTKILNAVRSPDAKTFGDVATQTSGVHSGIARLIQAQLLLTDGKQSEAESVLKTLAAEGEGMPAELAAALMADAKTPDDTGSAFRATALERSGWAALQVKDYKAATKAFKALQQMENSPESMKERAKSALAFIQSEGLEATPETKE